MMSIQEYQDEMKNIQDCVCEYLDHDDKVEENYENLKLLFSDIKIHDDPHLIKPVLYILTSIRTHFFAKIEQILNLFKEDMTKFFFKHRAFQYFQKQQAPPFISF